MQLARSLVRGISLSTPSTLPTGFATLDAALPGGGWPQGAVTELLSAGAGIGELSLLLPALAQLTRSSRQIAMLGPPCLPYAPALQQHGVVLRHLLLIRIADDAALLWAAEQLLRCSAVGAVLLWPRQLDDRRVRRLQLAAEAGGSCALLYREAAAHRQSSPAALRMRLQPAADGLQITIIKARGGSTGAVVVHTAAAA